MSELSKRRRSLHAHHAKKTNHWSPIKRDFMVLKRKVLKKGLEQHIGKSKKQVIISSFSTHRTSRAPIRKVRTTKVHKSRGKMPEVTQWESLSAKMETLADSSFEGKEESKASTWWSRNHTRRHAVIHTAVSVWRTHLVCLKMKNRRNQKAGDCKEKTPEDTQCVPKVRHRHGYHDCPQHAWSLRTERTSFNWPFAETRRSVIPKDGRLALTANFWNSIRARAWLHECTRFSNLSARTTIGSLCSIILLARIQETTKTRKICCALSLEKLMRALLSLRNPQNWPTQGFMLITWKRPEDKYHEIITRYLEQLMRVLWNSKTRMVDSSFDCRWKCIMHCKDRCKNLVRQGGIFIKITQNLHGYESVSCASRQSKETQPVDETE